MCQSAAQVRHRTERRAEGRMARARAPPESPPIRCSVASSTAPNHTPNDESLIVWDRTERHLGSVSDTEGFPGIRRHAYPRMAHSPAPERNRWFITEIWRKWNASSRPAGRRRPANSSRTDRHLGRRGRVSSRSRPSSVPRLRLHHPGVPQSRRTRTRRSRSVQPGPGAAPATDGLVKPRRRPCVLY
jgi:hypothetical protein